MYIASRSADKLNGLLQQELLAVETYEKALDKIDDQSVRTKLVACQRSHASRVSYLTEHVEMLGAKPAVNAKLWSSFIKMVEAGTAALVEKTAIDMLEAGENKELRDYKRILEDPDETVHVMVHELLPAQEETLAIVKSIKDGLH